MRKALLLIWLVLPGALNGQSTLNFPKVFMPSELGSTGFAVVNPDSTDASATFTLRRASGSTIVAGTLTIPAGGQLAKLGTELFGFTSESGWVQVTSEADGLTGFFLTGDFTTFTDGADAAPTSTDLVLPLVVTNTEINVANTAATTASVTLSLRDANGSELGSSAQSIAGMGVFQGQAASVFSGVDLGQATHILITGGTSISAVAVVTDFLVSPSIGVTNGVPTSSTTTELNFAHVISGEAGTANWLTTVGVTNLGPSTNTVTVTFTPLIGSPISAQRTIAANGSLRESAEALFGFTSSVFEDGWVQVISLSSAPITGFVAYADSEAGGLAIVPVQDTALTEMLFAHVAQADGWGTGVALLNTSNTTANIEIYAMNPDGGLIGGALDSPAAAFTLDAGQKIARVLHDPWIPNANTNGGFVYVRTTNGVPLFGIELFFLSNLNLLSNVAPGPLAPGFTYTPPPPPGLFLTSLTPTTISRGSTLTLTGTGFSSGDTVVFTTATGTTSVASVFGSSTSLTATVPLTAISGPVLVQSGSTSSSSQILDVTATSTTLIQTQITVTAGQTTTGVDIYVPTPVAALNITDIGTGDRTQGIFAASQAAEVTQGQTTDLLIFGTGMSSENGSTLTISGTGITISPHLFNGDALFVEIVIASNAALGPRTVTVTNSNLDTSVLSGGLIIK